MSNLEQPNGQKSVRVWCDGCFDAVHFGHANSLRQAKSMGDYLVVGVHNDADITKFKGPPLFTESERYEMVRAVRWVNEVVEGSTYWPTAQTLTENKCDFATHGDDISIATDGRDPYAALKQADKLKVFKRTEGTSTTDIVEHVLYGKSAKHESANCDQLMNLIQLFAKQVDSTLYPANHLHVYEHEMPMPSVNGVHKQTSQQNLSKCLFCEPDARSDTATLQNGVHQSANADKNNSIGYIGGFWDLFHPGHLALLRAAKQHVKHLIVGVQHDETDSTMFNVYERTLSVLACRYTDVVVINAPMEPTEEFLINLKVNKVFCVSKPSSRIESVPSIMLGPDVSNKLTTEAIIARVLSNRAKFESRNHKKKNRESAKKQA